MQRYQWSRLNKQQLGRFYEQFVQMELAMLGFELYPPAVDDHGVDLVARWQKDAFFEIQIKAIRKPDYLFLRKKHFEPSPSLHLAVGLHVDGQEPVSLLIPSCVWNEDKSQDPLLSAVFSDNDYEGLQSDPEYGLRLTASRFEALHQRYAMHNMLTLLVRPSLDSGFLRTVFCDDFVFTHQPLNYLENHPLPQAQAQLAMAIHASKFDRHRAEETAKAMESLNSIFHWQDNSEGPMIFAQKVMYLTDRYAQNLDWFVKLWRSEPSVKN